MRDMILADVSNKDVQSGIDNVVDGLGLLWDKILWPLIEGVGALIAMLPPIVNGILVAIIIGAYLWRRARNG